MQRFYGAGFTAQLTECVHVEKHTLLDRARLNPSGFKAHFLHPLESTSRIVDLSTDQQLRSL